MKRPKPLSITVVILCTLVAAACGQKDSAQGKYMADNSHSPGLPSIVLELGANGQGSWQAQEDIVQFKWDTRGDEIFLHTRAGGVVAGSMKEEGIHLALPGLGKFVFKRMPDTP